MKEYLNEKNYQHAKKKIAALSIVVMIITLILGVGVIICGVVARHNAEEEAAAKQAAATARIAEIEKEQADLDKQIEEKSLSCLSAATDNSSNDFSSLFTNHQACTDQEMSLRSKKSKLGQEAFALEHANYEVWEDQFIMYYVFGGLIIVAGAMVAGAIYVFAKKREIHAFTVQQSMPVAQEAIGKMASTVGNAAKEVARGIHEGMQDNPNSNNGETPTPDNNLGQA